METTLIGVWFRKLLEALRLRPTAPFALSANRKGERSSQPFTVTTDGLTIRGTMFYPRAKPSRLYPPLIICHGIPGSGTPRPTGDPGYEDLAEEFTSLGIAAVIFNFRGCGESDGNFDMMGWTRDLEAVIDKTLNTPYMDPTRLMIVGFSGGGAAAIKVAAENENIYGLAVVGTPADFGIFDKDMESVVPDFRERGIIRDPDFPPDLDRWIDSFVNIEPRRWIRHFKGRHALIVHGDQDELVPVDHAHELQDAAPAGVAKIRIIPGGVHRLRLDERCINELKAWVLECLGWKATQPGPAFTTGMRYRDPR